MINQSASVYVIVIMILIVIMIMQCIRRGAFAPHLPRICPALALPCAVAIVAAIVIDSSPITLVKKFPRRVSLNILRGFALRGCADRRRGIGGGSLPLPDGVAGLRGIVGGYRLMEGRTVAATGNGCGDRRGASVAVLIRLVCGALFH